MDLGDQAVKREAWCTDLSYTACKIPLFSLAALGILVGSRKLDFQLQGRIVVVIVFQPLFGIFMDVREPVQRCLGCQQCIDF